jgi:hypothetical protein
MISGSTSCSTPRTSTRIKSAVSGRCCYTCDNTSETHDVLTARGMESPMRRACTASAGGWLTFRPARSRADHPGPRRARRPGRPGKPHPRFEKGRNDAHRADEYLRR